DNGCSLAISEVRVLSPKTQLAAEDGVGELLILLKDPNKNNLLELKALLRLFPGKTPVSIVLGSSGATISVGDAYMVNAEEALIGRLKGILGNANVIAKLKEKKSWPQ
ncbi:MAG: hypothetical protein Q8N36_05315, partial [bacterium]|nr:hypothetical protein [bacterium]